jgi:hypothetical protein
MSESGFSDLNVAPRVVKVALSEAAAKTIRVPGVAVTADADPVLELGVTTAIAMTDEEVLAADVVRVLDTGGVLDPQPTAMRPVAARALIRPRLLNFTN